MHTSTNMMLKTNCIERGIALPIVLIFLVVMMLLGVTTIRNVTLGEKISGNLHNQQLAFQAAERALRYCENAMQGTVPAGGPKPAAQSPATPNLWDVTANWDDGATVSIAVPTAADSGLAKVPRCMVEGVATPDTTDIRLSDFLRIYRITARGFGGTENAVVMLQSYLKFNE